MDKYHALTRLPCLHCQDIADVVWAAEGVKPASQLSLGKVENSEVDELIEILNDYSLFISYRVIDFDGPYPLLTLSLQEEKVRGLEKLDDFLMPRWERWRRFGQLYGYPVTAIEGFVAEKKAEEQEVLPQVFSREEVLAFFATRPFRLSQANWRQEAEVARKWIAVLKKVAPATYEHILLSAT